MKRVKLLLVAIIASLFGVLNEGSRLTVTAGTKQAPVKELSRGNCFLPCAWAAAKKLP